MSCEKTIHTFGTDGVLFTRTNFLTLKYRTDSWGTDAHGFKLIITAFKVGVEEGLVKKTWPFENMWFKSRYLNYEGRTDSALTLLQISRDPTPCMAETALAMVNLEVGLDYSLRT